MHPITAETESALKMLFASARRMPEDKLNWSPLDAGRTVMDQLQECAITADMFLPYFDASYTPMAKGYEEFGAISSQWKTIDECEAKCKELTAKLTAAIEATPAEKMAEVHDLPWGEKHTLGAIATFHAWNMTYHLGQINYIQTLYGDKEM